MIAQKQWSHTERQLPRKDAKHTISAYIAQLKKGDFFTNWIKLGTSQHKRIKKLSDLSGTSSEKVA